MKKLFYLLLLLPFGFLASCSDDDNDNPYVEVSATIDNVYKANDQLYIVEGEDLVVESMTCKSLNGVEGGFANVYYQLNGNQSSLPQVTPPFSFTIDSARIPMGVNFFVIIFDIYQKDKNPAASSMAVKLNKVATVDEIPEGAVAGPIIIGPVTIGKE